ncbi:MAG TPA: hypothetical protein VE987_19425, partial [Polyangiaceae bacterium]|nr:hypothetical protein [Polyangiaceae bacterium]
MKTTSHLTLIALSTLLAGVGLPARAAPERGEGLPPPEPPAASAAQPAVVTPPAEGNPFAGAVLYV